ncbi:unnamed protein product [Rotaria sordida]|uniref:C2 domain-containing protein n=1 Tax=Rotaria sordida TaxID=392033 RepID=A0A813MYY1_9BILA|nr:unnamed protein product [Rotaria sordida]CAF0726814.1 unnamed protein product [Rotaria sordida]CAF0732652.1 unnamed protein product [Rotaria sordida]
MAQGHLHVAMMEAAKPIDKDTVYFKNPCLELYTDEKNKTKVSVFRDVQRPVWNETFDFDVWPNNENLHINVHENNEGKKGDLIGSAQISLDDVIKNGHFENWIKLTGFPGDDNQGDVHIRMTYEQKNQ